jgi:hypothetical protein
MQRATTVRTRARIDRERHLFTGKLRGEGGMPGLVVEATSDRPLGLLRLSARDIRVEILKSELQLIRIDPFRTSAELAALKLPDDETELLDLAVPLLHTGRKIVDQLMKECRIGRQIREIEPHA